MKNTLIHLATAALVAAFAMPAAQAATVFDNLGSAQAGADPVMSFGPLAISFNSGATGGLLTSVAALLKSDSADLVGSLSLTLMADQGMQPGTAVASLGTLSSAAISTADFASYSFGTLAPVKLAANTTYWIEISAASPVAVEWSWSTDQTALGVAGQASYSQEFGVLMNSDGGPYQASISVSAVPEPASYLLFAFGLAAVGFGAARRKAVR